MPRKIARTTTRPNVFNAAILPAPVRESMEELAKKFPQWLLEDPSTKAAVENCIAVEKRIEDKKNK